MADEILDESPAPAENSLATPVEADAEPVETKEPESAPVAKDPGDAIAKMQKRIDKLTWEKNEALRRENDTLRARIEAQSKPAQSETAAPTLEGVAYDEAKYQAAMREYIKAQIEPAVAAKADEILSKREQAQATKEREGAFESKVAAFAKEHPDYNEKVMESADNWSCTTEMAQIIKASDVGPEIAYYLATNAEQSHSIAKLPPILQAREIGRLEAKFDVPKNSPPPVSKAPPPPARLEASDSRTVAKPTEVESDSLSDAEWAKARNKQLAKQRG